MKSNIYDIFIKETRTHLVNCNNTMIHLETHGIDRDKLNFLKGEIHTLKGDARMLGFKSISLAVHKIEDFIQYLETADEKIRDKVIKTIFDILDVIEKAVDKLPGEKIDIALDSYNVIEESIEKERKQVDTSTRPEKEKTGTEQKSTYDESVMRKSETGYINIKTEKVKNLIQSSTVFTMYSSRFNYVLNQLRDIELSLAGMIKNEFTFKKLGEIINDFSHELSFYDLSTKQFEERITKLRLIPLSTIFNYFPRLVHDVAKSTNKEIEFSIIGKQVELDESIVGQLKNILIHILQNAVVHGIEESETRVKAGKPQKGKINLSAFNKGNTVVIEVIDDGAGLDINAITQHAIKKGIITKEGAEKSAEPGITSLIFKPGFSTKSVGTFSGRGVGMDAVAKVVKELNGKIDVHSEKGKGTTFTITFPLVSSYIPITVFLINDRLYGIPSSYIEFVIYAGQEQVKKTSKDDKDRFFITINDIDISLIDLQKLYNSNGNNKNKDFSIIICRHKDEVTGFLVSELILAKKLIITKINYLAEKMDVILGGVHLGSENIIPVFNIPKLFSILENDPGTIVKVKSKKEIRIRDFGLKNILLVEDSIITRVSEKNILLDWDLNVHEASNGRTAINILKKEEINCIITDIEMPVMNGIELISFLKSDKNYKNIPVIVISSYKRYSEKLDTLGVDAVIDKSVFSKELLIKALKKIKIL
ncbi:MAG: response regulator [Spirochaetales bacterium]|nr:response regulator [Spirochaetales bacterium]